VERKASRFCVALLISFFILKPQGIHQTAQRALFLFFTEIVLLQLKEKRKKGEKNG